MLLAGVRLPPPPGRGVPGIESGMLPRLLSGYAIAKASVFPSPVLVPDA